VLRRVFCREFVVVWVIVDELELAALRVVVRFGRDRARRIGDDRRSLQVIREIVGHGVAGKVLAGDALVAEEDVPGPLAAEQSATAAQSMLSGSTSENEARELQSPRISSESHTV
jgi:hypothetical protein